MTTNKLWLSGGTPTTAFGSSGGLLLTTKTDVKNQINLFEAIAQPTQNVPLLTTATGGNSNSSSSSSSSQAFGPYPAGSTLSSSSSQAFGPTSSSQAFGPTSSSQAFGPTSSSQALIPKTNKDTDDVYHKYGIITEDDNLTIKGSTTRGLMAGMVMGSFLSLSTVIIFVILLATVTNIPLPQPIVEYFGYKTPYQFIAAYSTKSFKFIVGIIDETQRMITASGQQSKLRNTKISEIKRS